jgi:V-type H+-transporting ATPase subunit H
MSADAESLLEKYRSNISFAESAADVHAKVLEMRAPNWGKYEATSQYKDLLAKLSPADGGRNKENFNTNAAKACMAAVSSNKVDTDAQQYVLAVMYDMLREDAGAYSVFEQALKGGCPMHKAITESLGMRNSSDHDSQYVADKGAWLLSACMGHMPRYFNAGQVQSLTDLLLAGKSCSELGALEAITNLLKAEAYRELVWTTPGVADLILNAEPKASPSPILYKSVFAIWMVSFDAKLAQSLKQNNVVKKIKAILNVSRTEKVIRLCLTVLKNFLTHKAEYQAICEEVVEEGILEAVQQLEYEKWRDAELYDDIRDLVQLISSEVKELSNFDRYMRELESGALAWGFIHSSKFFGENIMKFEAGEFKALKLLVKLLAESTEPTTLAVACHDIGEFVSLHPFGKKQVARLGVKERVMMLMGCNDADKREVRREALLCCQKIMLNKWQDVAGAEKK